jgi:hypothetical protein
MLASGISQSQVWEDGGATCLARVHGNDAAAITQATISTITYKLYDVTGATPTTVVTSASLTVASVVYDALQTDSRWTADGTGYNFAHTVAAASLSDANRAYRVEYRFVPATGEAFHAVFELHTRAVWST